MHHDRSFVRGPIRLLHSWLIALTLIPAFAAVPERAEALEVMYVSNPGAKRVDRFAMDGRSLGSIDVKDYDPFGLAVNSKGDVYVSDATGGRVYRYGSDGKLAVDFETGLKQQYFLATDSTDRLFVSNCGDDVSTGSVAVYDRDGRFAFEITENIDHPYGIAFDRSGYLYVANFGSSQLTRYDADGKFDKAFALSEGKNPVGLAITPDDRLFVSSPDRGQVYEYDLSGGFVRALSDTLSSPIGLASDERGDLYVVNKTSDSVSMFDRDGKPVGDFSPRGLESPFGIAIGVPEPSVYVLGGLGAVAALALTRRGRGKFGVDR